MSQIVKEQEIRIYEYQISIPCLPMKKEIKVLDVGTKEVECKEKIYSIEQSKRRAEELIFPEEPQKKNTKTKEEEMGSGKKKINEAKILFSLQRSIPFKKDHKNKV